MRLSSVLQVLLVTVSASALAQDAAMMAMQQAQQASQQAIQANQQASQQASQAAQQASQQANQQAAQDAFAGGISPAAKPSFSIKPGTYSGPVTLRLKSRSRGSVIFYTTDGWTPTTLSNRYVGPITLNATTNLQAIAVASGARRSAIASGVFVVASGAQATPVSSKGAMSPTGSSIELVFTKPVNSQGLQVGDALPVALAQDLYLGGQLVASQATPVLVTVTQVDGPGRSGLPASLSFAVRSVSVDGRTILLSGGETKEGAPHTGKANAVGGIPFVGISAQFVRGGDVQIPVGAMVTAHVVSESLVSSTR